MLLKRGECILCDTQEECLELANMLHAAGYSMLGKFGSVLQFALLPETAGFRWMIGEEFPHCIARIPTDMAHTLLENGTLSDANGVNEHTWYTFQEWLMKDDALLPNIDDLI